MEKQRVAVAQREHATTKEKLAEIEQDLIRTKKCAEETATDLFKANEATGRPYCTRVCMMLATTLHKMAHKSGSSYSP